MSSTINVTNNNGIISTGMKSKNIVYHNQEDIRWERLKKEISDLKSSSDASIRKFADEAEEAAKKEDKRGIRDVLKKWLPCIGGLIESSYYIIKIAKNFNIGIG
ncbi:MAG: hypothetical protein J1F01_02430 [Oscillospiraceae bacterium]|nr:hypothetical protein [Oscillospiraceae bacterium]